MASENLLNIGLISRKLCFFFSDFPKLAQVAELADALDLGSSTERCGGSTPPLGTTSIIEVTSINRWPMRFHRPRSQRVTQDVSHSGVNLALLGTEFEQIIRQTHAIPLK